MTQGTLLASETDLQQVKEIVLSRLAGHPVRILLYGSHATGRAVASSDIDVAVLPAADLPLGLLSQVRSDLEESCVPYKVDLVDLSRTDTAFRQRVLSEGIEWTA